jgi:hypothetical protein
MGLAIHTAAQHRQLAMGLLGLRAAPIAFYVARAVDTGTFRLSISPATIPGSIPLRWQR